MRVDAANGTRLVSGRSHLWCAPPPVATVGMAYMTSGNTDAKRLAQPRTNGGTPAPRRRLKAEERRHLILEGARKAFSKAGDLNGTTIKTIAQQAKISEGVIYQHFASKEELFSRRSLSRCGPLWRPSWMKSVILTPRERVRKTFRNSRVASGPR
jgi:Bacterial regulatory proteins, tetR family